MIQVAKKNAPKPTIGRIVHYRADQDRVLAAIVTEVKDRDVVNLVVFADNEHNKEGYPSYLVQNVEHGSKTEQWDWPPKEGE